MMLPSDLWAIMPIMVLVAGTTLLMLQVAALRSPALTRLSTLLILIVALGACVGLQRFGDVTPLLRVDGLAQLFTGLFCATAAICVLLSREYLPGLSDEGDEYYLLLLLATLGAVVMVHANHVASLLLGLELLSVSLYALIAYPARLPAPIEAATKYLVLSGGASAAMLFGFALFYAGTGSLSFDGMSLGLSQSGIDAVVFSVATVLVIGGMAFKLSAAPFHLWTPDVYEGAPVTVTAFLATVAKAAPFVALLRWLWSAELLAQPGVVEVLGALAVLSMLVGNLLALLQRNLKRMLAYSSIAHIGYALIVFCVAVDPAQRAFAGEAAVFYLCAYVVTTVAAFGLLVLMNTGGDGDDRADIDDVSGLFWRRPLAATAFLLVLLSLAGIPLTAGFIGKFYLIVAAVAGSHWVLLAALVLGSAIGIYYYLRVVFQMSQKPTAAGDTLPLDWGTRSVLLLLIAAILILGVVPQALMEYIRGLF